MYLQCFFNYIYISFTCLKLNPIIDLNIEIPIENIFDFYSTIDKVFILFNN